MEDKSVLRILEKFEKMDERFDRIDGRLDKMDGRLDRLESSVAAVENRLGRVEIRLTRVEGKVDAIVEQTANGGKRHTSWSLKRFDNRRCESYNVGAPSAPLP